MTGRRAAARGAALLLLSLCAAWGGERGGPAAPAPWWRTRFPPAAAGGGAPIPDVPEARLAAAPAAGPACGNFDGAVLTDGGAYLYGWAYDPRTGAPAAGVLVLDSGHRLVPAVHVFRERPDVAATMRDRRLLASGWALWLPPHRLSPGRHAFAARALVAGGELCRLEGEPSLEKPAAARRRAGAAWRRPFESDRNEAHTRLRSASSRPRRARR